MKWLLIPLLFLPIFSKAQIITTIAGNGVLGNTGYGGPANVASIGYVGGVAVDSNNNLYFSSSDLVTFSVVLKVSAAGVLSRFAGNDTAGFSGDGGPATAAKVHFPLDIAIDKKANVYISDLYANHRIRKVDSAGTITTFAGNGSDTLTGDGGPATAAGLGQGNGICFDAAGNLYVAAGSKIRRIDTAGIITTFAGTGVQGYSGDGGPASAAQFFKPSKITIDRHGNMYIADEFNNRIRKIDVAGIITTVAGNGATGFSGEGVQATVAQCEHPVGVCIDECDNLYISTYNSHRIRIVNGSGMIKTFAGTGAAGYSGDGGPPTAARLFHPNFLCINKNGDIYLGDPHNYRVRYVQMDGCKNTTETSATLPSHYVTDINPNPCSQFLTISSFDQIKSVTISNLAGQVVMNNKFFTPKLTLGVQDLPNGIYIIRINDTEVRRFMKQ